MKNSRIIMSIILLILAIGIEAADEYSGRPAYLYTFKQKLFLQTRETDDTPVIKEQYSRSGVILMTTLLTDKRWSRRIEELPLKYEDTLSAQKDILYSVDAIRKKSISETYQHQIEFGLNSTKEIVSVYPQNKNLLDVHGSALRFDLIYLPTVLQFIPKLSEEIKTGAVWEGRTALAAGSAIFVLKSSTVCINSTDSAIDLRIEIDQTVVKYDTGRFVLIINPRGNFRITLQRDTLIPESINCDYHFMIKAQGRNVDEIGVETEAGNYRIHSELQLIKQLNK